MAEKDAYDYYVELFKILSKSDHESKEVETTIMQLNTNADRAKYVGDLLLQYKLCPKFMPRIRKDDEKAVELRKKGNTLFHPKIRDYIKALEYYNESIAFADQDSENLGIAYANRSAIYFDWKQYDLCLENIKLAIGAKYPERLVPKLDKRARDCLEQMNNIPDIIHNEKKEWELKLSYEGKPKVPFIADCLELKDDDKFGRYIITAKNLKSGDVVAIEKPFSSYLLPDFKYKRCNNCRKENMMSLIPCCYCTSAMFCSVRCQEEAHQNYHKYECPVFDCLVKLYTKVMMLALRTVIKAITIFNDDLDDMKSYLDNIDESKINPFDIDYSQVTPQEHYCTIHVLATNQDKRTFSDILQRSTLSYIMGSILFEHSSIREICRLQRQKDFIYELIFRHVQTAPVNMHSLMFMDYDSTLKIYDQVQYGSGSYSILSMINHSCAPNVIRCSLPDGSVAVVINRPVKKGGQLFDNYGQHHCLEEKKERQFSLNTQYLFKCRCEACVKDYPLYPNLPNCNENPVKDKDLQLLQKHDLKTALRKLPEYCSFIDKYDPQYPLYEISSAQECLLRCMQIITNEMPLTKRFD